MNGSGGFRFHTNLALHTLIYNRRQYTALFLVCLTGMAIMLSSVFITDGMLAAVYEKSRIYYGSDLVFLGGYFRKTIGDEDKKIELLKKLVPEGTKFSKRIEYDGTDASFFFEGASVKQRMFKGVDFDSETDILSKLNFAEGGPYANSEHNSVIISDSVARRLGAKVGDMLILQNKTDDNYINTIEFVVSGIFIDSSLFGMYTSYMDIIALRKLIDRGDDYVNRICMRFPDGEMNQSQLVKLHSELSKSFNMHPLSDDKNDFYKAIRHLHEGEPLYGIISLSSNIKDLQVLIDAMRAVVALVIIVLMTIMSVGIGSAYRIIVIKRTTEIGTYRAVGMTPKGVRNVFMTEAIYLLLAGFLAALLVSAGFVQVLKLFDFSFIPAFDIFLVNSHLLPSINIVKFIAMFLIVGVTTILSMLFTIRNVVRMSPVKALATTT